ncbi:MAG: aminotransferase class V-fold PLP-dependent enzyme [Acidobacteriota bacterium]
MTGAPAATAFDVAALRRSIPALGQARGDQTLLFADNAATSLKPQPVIDAVLGYYTGPCANVHRGVHLLAEEAGRRYEAARESVAELIGASRRESCLFVRNTTEAMALVAHIAALGPEDEVVAAQVDHHSNLLPWGARARLRLVEPGADGRLDPEAFGRAVTPRTRLVAVGHGSNVTGWIAPVRAIVDAVRSVRPEVLVAVDAAQTIAHGPVEVGALDCDFLAFSGHKMMAPSGVGVLYARPALLDGAPPWLQGGGMVDRVDIDASPAASAPPHRFEAGTPNIEGALGLGAGCELLLDLDPLRLRSHARELSRALDAELSTVDGLRAVPALGGAEDRLPIRGFTLGEMPADQVAEILSHRFGILVASGVHCAEPLARYWGYTALVRVSLHAYNTVAEVSRLGEALRSLSKYFS